MAALLDWSGSRVIYQNMESLAIWGDCQGDERQGAQILEDLTKSEEVLGSLLTDVRNGKECRLLAHMPRPHPPDPSSSQSVRPYQYPLSSGRLTTEHSVGSLAHTEVQPRAPAGHYSRSTERPLSRLSSSTMSGPSRGTPFSACNLEFGAQRVSRNLSRSSLGYGDSLNLSGLVTTGVSSPIKYPSSPRGLLLLPLSQKVIKLLDVRSNVNNAFSSEQEAQRNIQKYPKGQGSELVPCSRTNSARTPSTEYMRFASVSRPKKPVRRTISTSRLAPCVPCNSSPAPVDMSVDPASAFSLGTALLPRSASAFHNLPPSLSSTYPGTSKRQGRCSQVQYSEIEASQEAGGEENSTFPTLRSRGSCGSFTQAQSMDLPNTQMQRLPRRESHSKLWGMGRKAATKPELSFPHSDQMQSFSPINSQGSMKAGGEMRMGGRMSLPSVIPESTGSNIQGMGDEDLEMGAFRDLVDEDSKMKTYQDMLEEDCGGSPPPFPNSGTEKHFSGSSPAPDTDITERADLAARIADLAEAQTDMLASMFPRHVLEHMVGVQDCETPNLSELARSHEDVTVMFIDVVGFTSMSNEVPSQSVMAFLSQFFTVLDRLLEDFDVYKVDTCGDCYIVAGGLMERSSDGELVLAGDIDPKEGAKQVMEYISAVILALKNIRYPHNFKPASFRVGVHTGPCVTGVIGTKLPKFSLWGDTMNTASRMESTSQPGLIQISKATFVLLDPCLQSQFTTVKGVEVKGKGMMETHVLSMEDLIEGRRASFSLSGTADLNATSSRLNPMMALQRSQSLLRQACRLGMATTEATVSRRVCKDFYDSKAKATKKRLLAQLVNMFKAPSSFSST
eukprot:gene31579-6776_t